MLSGAKVLDRCTQVCSQLNVSVMCEHHSAFKPSFHLLLLLQVNKQFDKFEKQIKMAKSTKNAKMNQEKVRPEATSGWAA